MLSDSQWAHKVQPRNASGENLLIARNTGSMAAYYPPPVDAKPQGLLGLHKQGQAAGGSQSTLAIMNHKVSIYNSSLSQSRDIPVKDQLQRHSSQKRSDQKIRYSTGMLPPLNENSRQTATLDPHPGSLADHRLEKRMNPYKVQRHQSKTRTNRDGQPIKNQYVYRAVHSKEEIFDEKPINLPGDKIHSEKLLV